MRHILIVLAHALVVCAAAQQDECKVVAHEIGVTILRSGQPEAFYHQTDRTLFKLARQWPPGWGAAGLSGKKVLDVGTGHGRLVKDLLELGVDAHGLDISLPAALKGNPRFHEADALDTKMPGESWDVIYVNYSVFTFEEGVPFYTRALGEAHRILKPGGRIRIGPLFSEEDFSKALAATPGLKAVPTGDRTFVELEKR